MDELKVEKREKLKELILDSKNTLLKIIDISYGGTNSAQFNMKHILTEPIRMCAPKILLVHNHPSGNPQPSIEDIKVTEEVYNVAKTMGIELVDHIVIGNDKYESAFASIKKILN